MRTPNVLRTQAFRIVVIYLAIFAMSAIALAGFVYWNTALVLRYENDKIVDAHIAGLVEQYQSRGIAGLTDVIISRSTNGGQGLYLLANKVKQPIAGNLDAWPAVQAAQKDFIEFIYERKIGDTSQPKRARGKIFGLPQGLLLVARDDNEKRELDSLFRSMMFGCAGLIFLAMCGGVLVGRNAGRGILIRAHA